MALERAPERKPWHTQKTPREHLRRTQGKSIPPKAYWGTNPGHAGAQLLHT